MDNSLADQRLRTMCMNWCFLQDSDFLTTLDLEGYKRLRCNLYKKLISHPQFETLVRPAYEEFKNTDDGESEFNKCQVFVFKLMDLMNRENNLTKDFE